MPQAANRRGRCADIAPETNAEAPNITASSTSVRVASSSGAGATCCGTARVGGGALGIRKRFAGKPNSTCKAAQIRQVARQPISWDRNVDTGQPMVDANPAISVMPVMALRAPLP